jgi:thiol-disulfide isomerase/thioredoxin
MKTVNTLPVLRGLLGGLAAATGLALAGEATLKVGDAAPKLQVAKWVQGEEVKEFDKAKAYIVEFWATWCGPCKASIPHLNEIHQKFKEKGLVVIGQNVWERDRSAVEPFLKTMGDKMTYRVAMDTEGAKGKMAETWMEAAGQNGIPAAFLVGKQGRIAWIGHPMELKERTIEEVLEGTFDFAKAAADHEKQTRARAQLNKLGRDLSTHMRGKEWDKAEAVVTDMEKLMPEDERDGLASVRMEIFFGREDYKAAFKLAGELSARNKENAMLQNAIAWDLLTREGIKERDLGTIEKIAVRANEASGGKDPAILDTLARVWFMQDKKSKAIETQQKAVDLADEDMKKQLQEILDAYKEGKLPKAD